MTESASEFGKALMLGVASLLGVALLLVACGDDGESGNGSGNAPTIIEAADHRIHPYEVEWKGVEYVCFIYSHGSAEEGGVSCLELGEDTFDEEDL